jgi:hypothetical protein
MEVAPRVLQHHTVNDSPIGAVGSCREQSATTLAPNTLLRCVVTKSVRFNHGAGQQADAIV